MLNSDSGEESLKRVIDEFTSIFELWLKDTGTAPYAGRILMTILLSDKPLTQKDIAERLNSSVSTVSRNIKLITDNPPLIIKSRVPNSKEWQYEKRKDTPVVLLSGMILSFRSSLRNNMIPMERSLIELKNLDKEFLEGFKAQEFIKILEKLLSASNVMIEELDKLLMNFQSQITGELTSPSKEDSTRR